MITANLHKSVLRRGISLLAFTVLGSLFNLALAYVAAWILAQDAFGIFYAAVTVINILFAPAAALNLFYTGILTKIFARNDGGTALDAVRCMFGSVFSWGGGLLLLALLFVGVADVSTASFSFVVAALVLVVTYASYLAEVGRVTFQAQNRVLHLGLYGVSWMVLRFLGGIAGLYVFSTVWGGLLGILIATVITIFVVFRPWEWAGVARYLLQWRRSKAVAGGSLLAEVRRGTFIKLGLSYVIFLTAAHLDILVAYLLLDRQTLSIYAASSVLPKGLLVATLPIVQFTFPMLVGEQSRGSPTASLMLRAYVLTIFAAGGGAAVVFLLRDQVCGGSFGVYACRADVMSWGLASIICFCLLRLKISFAYVSDRLWMPLVLIGPVLVGAGTIVAADPHDVQSLSKLFFTFSAGCFVFYFLFDNGLRRLTGRSRARGRNVVCRS